MSVSDFIDLMTQTIKVAPATGLDGFAKETFGADVSYSGRVSGKTRVIRTASGEVKDSTKTVWLATTDVISPDARVTLPAGEVPVSPPILAVGTFPDENGAHHTVLYL